MTSKRGLTPYQSDPKTNPLEILTVANYRQLRPAEISILNDYIAALRESVTSDKQQDQHSAHMLAIEEPDLRLGLHPSGAFRLTFPDQHSITIPTGTKTQADMALAASAILRLLRDREQQRRPKTIATPAALTQHQVKDLVQALRASDVPIRRAAKAKAKLDEALALLEDLDLQPIEGSQS